MHIDEIKKVQIEPGDIIIIRFDCKLSKGHGDTLRNRLEAVFPNTKFLVLEQGVSIEILTEARQ